MSGMRWIKPPKLVALGAAVGVGLFLSVASHSFDWSEGSTFVVACALVGLLALFGPAVFLFERGVETVGTAMADTSTDVRIVQGRLSPAHSTPIDYARLEFPHRSFNANSHASNLAYRISAERSRVEANIYDVPLVRYEPASDLDLDFDLDSFVALAGRPQKMVDEPNATPLPSLREAVLSGPQG